MIIDRKRIAAALSGYKIGDELGVGGFGLVVAARHRRLKRDVAIKVIPAETAVPGKEFTDEAELLASLDHPHIVRVHDYFEADGLDLIVMELLGGGTLARRWRGLSQPQACAVGLAVAAALAHAHERGILHRDIKMGNVLFDTAGLVKLGDFGIARMFTGSGVTGTPHGAGTPGYMAPEQIAGGRLTPATDLYALGVLLYQVLTGAPPFDPTLPPAQLWH
jgi:serine/threonine protein kinase